jgi:inner membrane protein
MDTFTHIVLGACIGEATAGKQLGTKAMLAGVVGQNLPDIDFLAYFWLNKTDNLLAHRGITHSVFFAVLVTVLFSLLATRLFNKKKIPAKYWWLLFGINLFVHITLDGLNAYGVGWGEPFDDHRYSFHLLYVADPFFSIFPFIGFVLLFIIKRRPALRRLVALTSIGFALLYTGYALFNKLSVESDIRKDMEKQGIVSKDFFTTPTPLNCWLWFIVIKDSTGFYTGYRSVFDRKNTTLTYTPRNDYLLEETKNKEDVANLLKFSSGYYSVTKWNDTLVFNVLRFGQAAGWYDPDEKFAFYYFLDRPEANHLLVQRGRFQNWNRTTFTSFIKRIRGE